MVKSYYNHIMTSLKTTLCSKYFEVTTGLGKACLSGCVDTVSKYIRSTTTCIDNLPADSARALSQYIQTHFLGETSDFYKKAKKRNNFEPDRIAAFQENMKTLSDALDRHPDRLETICSHFMVRRAPESP